MTAPAAPFVPTKPLFAALAGKEGEVLDTLGIPWRAGKPHIKCPYPGHDDGKPSWRWDQGTQKAFCTCTTGDSILDIVMKLRGLDFEAAKLLAAELTGRKDLIRSPGRRRPKSDAASLLAPPDGERDDGLVAAYLAHRLGVPPGAVPLPATPVAGWERLPYFDPPPGEGAPPELVGEFPCAVFGMVSPAGETHAHRIYLGPEGRGKAALSMRTDGSPRDPKKSAKRAPKEHIAGRCTLWGSVETATRWIITEGIETAAALALAHRAEIDAGTAAVAAAISAPGMEQFQPWPGTVELLIAADRDEGEKPGGKPGSRRGEQAARKLAGKLGEGLRVSILLPGVPGEAVDWLDILRRDGVESVRDAFRDPPAFKLSRPPPEEPAEAPASPGKAGGEPDSPKRPSRFRLGPDGVEKRVEREDPQTGERRSEWQWFCSPLSVLAATRGSGGAEWGRLLELTDHDGTVKTWAMPMAMTAGDGTAYREQLVSLGLRLAPGQFAKQALGEYLSLAEPMRKVRCVPRVGWHGGRFILPDALYSAPAEAAEEVILQTASPLDHAYRVAGDFETWRSVLARLAVGNSRLLLALSSAFAAPLLHLLECEGGGFHLRGGSSTGKTTALLAAGSIWGGGGVRGYVKSWRSTDNAMESVAATHCDTLLALDELAQIEAGAAGATAYMLSQGAGKMRAGRHGEGRAVTEWRVLFLSTGEISLADKVVEDSRGRRAMAGQQVRVVDLPADAGAGLGLFEELHGFASADALARHLKAAAAAHYGHAAREFLAEVAADIPGAIEAVRAAQAAFVRVHCPPGADGQVVRVAQRFGLVAGAGELAAALGIVPWPRGTATAGAARCFADWVTSRGGLSSAEEIEAVRAVRLFVSLHGSTRFERLYEPNAEDEVSPSGERANSRVGYRRQVDGGTELYVLPPAWREVCGGYDPVMTARALAERGMLIRSTDGGYSRSIRLPLSKKTIKAYCLMPAIFDGGDHD